MLVEKWPCTSNMNNIENEISHKIIGAAIEVHRILGGPGLLESIYEEALCHELALRGLRCARQVSIPVIYKGSFIKDPLYIDILVEDKVLVEVKATELDHPISRIQTLTYLKVSRLRLGLLINFGKEQLKDGIIRIVNGL